MPNDVDLFCLAIYKVLIVLLLLYGAFILWRDVCFTRVLRRGCEPAAPAAANGQTNDQGGGGGDQRLVARTGTRHSLSYLITNAERVAQGARTLDVGLLEQIRDHGVTDLHVDLYLESRASSAIRSEDGRRREIAVRDDDGENSATGWYACYAMANRCRTEYNFLDLLDKVIAACDRERVAGVRPTTIVVWLCDVETAEPGRRTRIWWIERLVVAFNRYIENMRSSGLVRVSGVGERSAFLTEGVYEGVRWLDRLDGGERSADEQSGKKSETAV